MKRKLFSFLASLTLLLLFNLSAKAQVSAYSFTQSSGSYVPISGGTVLGAASVAATQDDAVFTATIPFGFVFNGVAQTQVRVSTNGFLTFGATAPGGGNYAPLSSTEAYAGAVSPFGRDLQGGYATAVTRVLGSADITVSNVGPITVGSEITAGFPAGTTVVAIAGNTLTMSAAATASATNAGTAFYGPWSEIRVETLGSAPNQIYVVQWSNWRRFGTTLGTTQDMVLNFQVRLYEADNAVEIVYGNCTPGQTTFTTTNQVGLRGQNNTFATNVSNRLNVKGTNDNWLNSNPGTANTSGMLFNNVTPANVIANGLTYRWESPSCFGPSNLALSGLTSTSANVTWTAGFGASEYNIEWGTVGFTPGTGAELGAGSSATNSFNITGLTAETNYQVYVRSDCGVDGVSSWIGPLNVFTGYCIPASTSQASWISNFTTTNALTNLAHTAAAGVAGGYANLSATEFVRNYDGNPTNIALTAGGPTVGFAVWVDWNNNLVFEAGERVFNTTSFVTTANGVINIPVGTTPGSYRMRVVTDWNVSNPSNPCASISRGEFKDFTFEVVEVPVSPILSQDPAAPSCDLGTEITAAGTPEADVVWYWQTSAAGTSTVDEYTGPLTVFANGTYFIRAYHTVYDYWAAAESVTITNFPVVSTLPPAPTAAANPVCLPGTDISMPAPDAGFEYYWQTIENGSSTANNASTPWPITATGTYYVSMLETATNCWSETSSITVTVDTYVPGAPSVTESVFNICVGALSQEIEATAPSSGSVVVNFGSNLTWPVGGTTINGNITLPAGAIVTTATLTINGVTTTSSTWASDLAFNLTGAANVAQTSLTGAVVTNAGPFTFPVTVTGSGAVSLFLINNWSFGGTGTSQSAVLTVNYSLPVSTINWYDAAVAGDLVGSGSPFEAIGSPLMASPAEAGVYEFYASSESGACSSEERTLVTINVTPVAVSLVGVDATCNGGNNGTFSLVGVECGDAPFTFSVNGGAFGSIPFDLTAGTYSVIVRDVNNEESASYNVVVGEPAVVSGVLATAISATEIEVTWTPIGTETEWVIEYGPQGFTPGTGATETVDAIPALIGGLTSQTTYDFYVRSLCSPGFEGDNSLVASAVTLPSCGNTVYDNGGAEGDYLSSSNEVTVICPTNEGDYVEISFVSFETEESFDGIYVFDGTDITAPMLASANAAGFGALTQPGAYWGEDLPGPFFASNPEGCLTIQFLSDGFVEFAGFEYVITCKPIELTPGVDGEDDVCRLDMTIDLFDLITAGDDFGTWSFPINPGVLNGSILNVFGLPAGTYEAFYTVTNPFDTTVTTATVTLFNPSSAGQSGVVETCNFGPFNLFDGLSGTVDLGGTWYDPAGNALSSALVIFNGQIAANYNYYYVTSNNVCPADTAFVEIQLQNCASVIENELQGFELYPNPTSDVVFVQYAGAPMLANFMLTDTKGAVIFAEKKNISVESVYEMDLSKLERGVYFLNIFGAEGSKVIKVVRN